MPRPPKPTKVLELSGAFKKDPQRKRPNEPKPEGAVGAPPGYFTEAQKTIWNELSKACFWSTDADRQVLEIACVLMERFRSDPDIKPSMVAQLISCLSKLGLSPSDRAKVTVPDKPKQQKSKWAI